MAIPFLSDISGKSATLAGNITTSGNIILSGASNEIIKSNGSIRLNIDSDANQSDRIFIVSTGANSELFRVDESGNGTFTGTVTANGTTLTGDTDISGKVSKTGDTMTGTLTIDGEGSNADKLLVKGSARIALENANATDSFYLNNTGGNLASVLDLGGALSLVENGSATFAGDVTLGDNQKLHGGRVHPRSVYSTANTNGFLIATDLASNAYGMIQGEIDLIQFNSSTKQRIEFSATLNNNGTVFNSKGTADIGITIKLFVYNSKWYVHVPQASTYMTCTAYISKANAYVGDDDANNSITNLTSGAVPSSGVTGSTDIVCKFAQSDAAFAGDITQADGKRIWFRNSSASSAAGAQSYIHSDGLNLKIKGDDNVRILGDGGGTIAHFDYTGKVGIGTESPDQKLQVEFANTDTSFSGGSGGAWGSEGIRIENTINTAGTMAMLHLRNNDADIHIAGIRRGTDDSDLGFFFEGTEKVLFENTGNATFAGDVTVNGGDFNLIKQSGSPTINMLYDGTNPSTNTLLHYLNFQVDYSGSHQDWGGIEHRTTSSGTRTKLNFNVKSTGGSVLNALSLDGTNDGTTATFAGKVGIGVGSVSPAQPLHIINTDGANIILNSNTGAENNGVWMTEGAAASPYTNGAYLHYDSTNNAFKINTGTSSLTTRFTIDRDTGNATFAGGTYMSGIVRSQKNIVSNSTYNLISLNSSRTINDYGGLNKDYMKIDLVTPGPNTDGGSSAHGFGAFSLKLANNGANTNMTEVLNISAGANATFAGNVTLNTGTNKILSVLASTHNASVAAVATLALGYTHSGGEAFGRINLVETATNSFDANMHFSVPHNNGSGGSTSRTALTLAGNNLSATFAGDITLDDDLNFSTNGFADISNTGTGAMRFKPSSQTLALTLTGANATFAGTVTATHFYGDGSNLTNVSAGAHNHDDRYYTETESRAKFTSTDASEDNYTFEIEDASNFTGNKWYHVATINSHNGGLHIRGAILNHVENFASQKLDIAIQVREAGSGANVEINGTVDVFHNNSATNSSDKAGVRVIQTSTANSNYQDYKVYVRVTRYSQLTLRLTQQGSVTFNTNHSSPLTSEPAPVSGGKMELDTSTLLEGHHVIVDSEAKLTVEGGVGGVNLKLNGTSYNTLTSDTNVDIGVSNSAHNVAGYTTLLYAGSPTAGTTNNIAGGHLYLAGGAGKGTGAGGDIIFRVAPVGSSGSAVNAYATALTISDDKSATFEGNVQVGGFDDGSNYSATIGWNAVDSEAVGTKRSALTFKTSQTGVNQEDIYKWDIAMIAATATVSGEEFGSDLAFLRSTRSSTYADEPSLILGRTGDATFAGIVSVPTGKTFRLYNAAGNGWGEIALEESENKIQFNRGIKPSGNLQSDQTLGTSTKRWHTLYAGSGSFTEETHIADIVDGPFTALRLMNQKTYGAGTGTNEKIRFAMGISENGIAYSGREGFVIELGIADQSDSSNAIVDFKVRDGGAIGTYQTVNGSDKSVTFAGTVASGAITVTGGSNQTIIDSHTAFDLTDGSKDTLLITNDATASSVGAIGPTIGFGNMNSNRRTSAIGTIRTGADHDNMGLAFFTHPGNGNDDTIVKQLEIAHDGTATFAGSISMPGIVSTLTNSILINYTGSDVNANDAGVKVMNDGSDWGMYVRKHTNSDYGIRIDSGGTNAFSIYSTTGGSGKTFGVHGGTGNTTIAGTLNTVGLQVTSDNNFYKETINSNSGGESWVAGNGWHRIIEISGGSGRGKCHFLIQTGGGSGTPCRVEAIVNTAWSNSDSTLSILYSSYPNFISDIRVVRNATTNRSYVDIKGGGEDYVDVTILPDGSTNAALVNFTNVNTLPSNDTQELVQTITGMIMSLSTGQGTGNGYDGSAGTGQQPFQVNYAGSIFTEDVTLKGNTLTIAGSSPYIKGTGTGPMRIKHTSGETMYLRPDEAGALSIFEGVNSQSVYMMTVAPNTNNTQNNSAKLQFQTRSKQSDGQNNAKTAVIQHETYDIGNNYGNLIISGTNKTTFSDMDVVITDNKAMMFGTGGDAFIKHTGSHLSMFNDVGAMNFIQRVNDGNIVFTNDDGDGGLFDYFSIDGGSATHDGTHTTAVYTKWQDKSRIALGSGKDLQLYHDGSNSYIETDASSAGDLYIKAQGTNHDLYLQAVDDIFIRPQGGENGIKVIGNGAVELYHDNSVKFKTTANGVNIHDSELGFAEGHGTASPGTAVIFAPYGAGTNIGGGEMQFYGGRSTGTAAGGSIKFFTSGTGSSGTSANAHVQALSIDSSQNANFGGHLKMASSKYLEFAGMGKLVNMEVTSWNTGAKEHNLLYSGWTSSTADYLSLKVAGNSTSGHGNLIIGDNGLWYGVMDTEATAQASDSTTNPNGGSNKFRVDNSGNGTFAGDVTLDANLFSIGQNLKFHAAGTHVMNIDINGKVYPNTHNAYDLGHSTSLAWRNIYSSGTIYATNLAFAGHLDMSDNNINNVGDLDFTRSFPFNVAAKTYNSANTTGYSTSSSTFDDWIKVAQFGEAEGTTYFNVKSAAHGTASFVISRGYWGSNAASITCTSSVYNANSQYANVRGIRVIREDNGSGGASSTYSIQLRISRTSAHSGYEIYCKSWGGGYNNVNGCLDFLDSATTAVNDGTGHTVLAVIPDLASTSLDQLSTDYISLWAAKPIISESNIISKTSISVEKDGGELVLTTTGSGHGSINTTDSKDLNLAADSGKVYVNDDFLPGTTGVSLGGTGQGERFADVRTNYLDSSQSSTTDPVLRLTDSGVANYDFIFPDTSTIKLETNTSSTKTFKLLNAGSGGFNFEASSATLTGGMQIDGKLGIGTAPTSRNLSVFRSTAGSIANFLHYTDSSTFQGLYIQVSQSTNDVIFQSSGTSGGGFKFYSGNAEMAGIDASGNASFDGELSLPSYVRHIGDDDTYFGFSGANAWKVRTGGVDRLSVTGDVHINSTTDLNINGTARRLNFTSGAGTVRTTTATSLILATNSTAALTLDASQNATFAGTGTFGGSVSVTGTVTASSDIVAYSDERLKTDVETLDGSKVYDMRGVSFTKDDKKGSGVIAQELEKIAPELVNNDSEFKSVAYGNITGYLIEAIKDLKAEVEELKKHKCNCNGSSK